MSMDYEAGVLDGIQQVTKLLKLRAEHLYEYLGNRGTDYLELRGAWQELTWLANNIEAKGPQQVTELLEPRPLILGEDHGA